MHLYESDKTSWKTGGANRRWLRRLVRPLAYGLDGLNTSNSTAARLTNGKSVPTVSIIVSRSMCGFSRLWCSLAVLSQNEPLRLPVARSCATGRSRKPRRAHNSA